MNLTPEDGYQLAKMDMVGLCQDALRRLKDQKNDRKITGWAEPHVKELIRWMTDKVTEMRYVEGRIKAGVEKEDPKEIRGTINYTEQEVADAARLSKGRKVEGKPASGKADGAKLDEGAPVANKGNALVGMARKVAKKRSKK